MSFLRCTGLGLAAVILIVSAHSPRALASQDAGERTPVIISAQSPRAVAHVRDTRDRAAKDLAKEIQRAGLHKVYVADFLSPSGKREFGGCYFASVFSTDIAKHAGDFKVLNRIEAQKTLSGFSPTLLQTPDSFAALAKALDIDGLLLGTIVAVNGQIKITLSLREVRSGRETWATEYNEKLPGDLSGNWPPGTEPGSDIIYFSGLDGVSIPDAVDHPDPSYPDEARRARYNGTVIVGALIGVDGRVKDVWTIRDPGLGLAERSEQTLRTWRFKPAKDIHDTPVAVSIAVEVTFRTK